IFETFTPAVDAVAQITYGNKNIKKTTTRIITTENNE
ncbi:unnamed protein product, partial [Rotaria sp. Silwood2]